MEILFIDEYLLVINKPAGLLSIQDGYDLSAPHIRTILEPEFGKCWIVHRLDKETSGVLMLARTKEIHRAISMMFEAREIKKEYRAVILGIPQQNQFEINLPLRINADRHHRTRVDYIKGKLAVTSIQVLESSEYFSLVSAIPRTGYTHQIRAHLAHLDFPIFGDSLYRSISKNTSYFPDSPLTRLALHSYSLQFEHPVTKKNVTVTSETPIDLRALLFL